MLFVLLPISKLMPATGVASLNVTEQLLFAPLRTYDYVYTQAPKPSTSILRSW